jgi:hypothetical protein
MNLGSRGRSQVNDSCGVPLEQLHEVVAAPKYPTHGVPFLNVISSPILWVGGIAFYATTRDNVLVDFIILASPSEIPHLTLYLVQEGVGGEFRHRDPGLIRQHPPPPSSETYLHLKSGAQAYSSSRCFVS